MKYENKQTVKAVYDAKRAGNPLLESLPGVLTPEAFYRNMENTPPLPKDTANMTLTERKRYLAEAKALFVPLDYMYGIYDTLYQMMQSTYMTQTSIETVRRINKINVSDGAQICFTTQAESGSLLGTPGIGKSSTVRRCLYQFPQVIEHERYNDEVFFCKQITYLFVECPSDCSIKTLAFNIVRALDNAVGTNHLAYLDKLKSVATSSVSTYLKTLCLTYHVGVLVIDEIQNVVKTAERSHTVKPLIKFLVELTNDTSTSVFFIGTPLAETVFTTEEHLRRRTRGLRLIPFKADVAYRAFIERLWAYQYTHTQAVLTDKLINKLYDYSGGIPDYTVKIFIQAQMQAITNGASMTDASYIQKAADYLGIKPPAY